MRCRIEIEAFELSVHIGCSEEERSQPQPLRVAFRVESERPFLASRTDRLQDTVDAAFLKAILTETIGPSRFATLERLGAEVERALQGIRRQDTPLACELRLTKPAWGWSYVHAWSL